MRVAAPHAWIPFFLLAALLAACSALPGVVPTPTPGPSPTTGPAGTASPAPTNTPSEPPAPTLSPSPTPTATPAAIGQENVPDLRLASSAGAGSLGELALSPDGRTIAAAGSRGVWLFDRFALETRFRLGEDLGAALAVAWSPDGSRLATGWMDGTVRIFEWAGGVEGHGDLEGHGGRSAVPLQIAVLVGHTGPVRTIGWSPDGARIASGGEDRAIRVWDAGTLANTFSFFHTSAIHSVDWHPGSTLLLIGEFDGSISVVNGADGSTAASFFAHDGWVDVVRWSPDGGRILSAGLDRQIIFWEANPRFDETIDFEQDLVIPTLFSITAAFWTADGAMAAAAGGAPYEVQFFDAEPAVDDEDVRVATLSFDGHLAPIEGLAAAPGGVLITTSQDNTLRVWEIESGTELRRQSALTGPAFTGTPAGAVFSPGGDRFATTGADGTLRVWDPETGALVWQAAAHLGGSTGVTWSASGAWIATGGTDNFTRVWNAGTGELVQELRSEGGRVNAVAFAPFGNQLASGGFFRIAQVWDAGTDQSPILLYPDVEITALGWSSSATLLAIGGSDGSVHLYNIPAVAEIGIFNEEHSTPIAAIAWEPGGRRVAAMDRRGTIAVWDNVSGELVGRHDGTGGVWGGLSWSPQGVLAAGSGDGTVLFLDAVTFEPLALKAGHAAGVADVEFSPDGRSLASVDSGGLIRFWELAVEGPEPLALTQPENGDPGAMPGFTWPPSGPITRTNAVDIDPLAVIGRGTASVYDATEDYLAVGGSTGVWVYERATREPVRYLEGGRTVGVALSPDGRFLVARELQLILVWDVERAFLMRAIPVGFGAQDALAWSPDGGLFASGERGGRVTVFNFRSGAAVQAWETGMEVTDLDWSPDGRRLGAASGVDIWLWNVPAGEQVALLLGHADVVRAIDFHPFEPLLLSGGDDQTLRLWELESIPPPDEPESEDEEIDWPPVNQDALTTDALTEVGAVAWSPSGELFYARQGCCVVLEWGAASRAVQSAIEMEGIGENNPVELLSGGLLLPGFGLPETHYSALTSVAWFQPAAERATTLVFLGDDRLLWDFDLLNGASAGIYDALNAEGASYDLLGGGPALIFRREVVGPALEIEPAVFDTHTGAWYLFSEPGGATDDLPGTWIASASPAGNFVAWNNTQTDPQSIDILDLEARVITPFVTLVGEAEVGAPLAAGLAWSPDQNRLAAGLRNGNLIIWRTVDGFQTLSATIFEQDLHALTWTPDGTAMAVSGFDGGADALQLIRLVNAVSGGVIREFALDFGRTAQALAFSPDGALLISGDSSGGVQIWDVETGERLADLLGHTLAVTVVAFSPDGTAFATSSRDGTVRVWGIEK